MIFRAVAHLFGQVQGLLDGVKNGLDTLRLYIIY